MKRIFLLANLILLSASGYAQYTDYSPYTLRPYDPKAVYFSPDNFDIKPDGKTDCTVALQSAIDQVEASGKFGIVFVPEGKYLLSNTVYVWKGIRLIGYGKNRPEFVLQKNALGYSNEEVKCMVHFVSSKPQKNQEVRDANPGTRV